MYRTLCLFFILCCALSASAQIKSVADTIGDDSYSNRKIYTLVERMPLFDGSFSIAEDFIKKNLRYPEDAQSRNIQGDVHIDFIVNQLGGLDSIRVQPDYPVWPSLDSEAVRIVGLTQGKWSVGKQQGKWVSVRQSAKISFYLPGQDLGLIKSETMDTKAKEAEQYYNDKKYKKALPVFLSIVESNPTNYVALHNLGLCRYQTGDKDGACGDWTKLLDRGVHTAHYLYLKYCRPSQLKAFIHGRYISK